MPTSSLPICEIQKTTFHNTPRSSALYTTSPNFAKICVMLSPTIIIFQRQRKTSSPLLTVQNKTNVLNSNLLVIVIVIGIVNVTQSIRLNLTKINEQLRRETKIRGLKIENRHTKDVHRLRLSAIVVASQDISLLTVYLKTRGLPKRVRLILLNWEKRSPDKKLRLSEGGWKSIICSR